VYLCLSGNATICPTGALFDLLHLLTLVPAILHFLRFRGRGFTVGLALIRSPQPNQPTLPSHPRCHTLVTLVVTLVPSPIPFVLLEFRGVVTPWREFCDMRTFPRNCLAIDPRTITLP